ncbi:hypothetical protein NC652_031082 [Populus alba x Populus x berolinensis]|nr:hypothetical protein NC652_031082 [Populus alba x Populus x berolinensis]
MNLIRNTQKMRVPGSIWTSSGFIYMHRLYIYDQHVLAYENTHRYVYYMWPYIIFLFSFFDECDQIS